MATRIKVKPVADTNPTDPIKHRLVTLGMEYISYQRDLLIDKQHLDDILETHAETVADVGDRVAELVSMRDTMKDRVKVREARAAIDIRFRYEANENKQTESAYKALVDIDEGRLAAVALHIEVNRECSRWESLRDAFQERGHALRQLGQLFAAGYWALATVNAGRTHEVQAASIEDRRERMAKAREDRNKARTGK